MNKFVWMKAFWAFSVTPRARIVGHAIAEHAISDGVGCPSIERLESMTGYSRASIYRAIAELEDLELLERCEVSLPSGHAVPGYRLLESQQRDLLGGVDE